MSTHSATLVERSELWPQAVEFFDVFVSAFHTFDGHLIAQRYLAPYIALNADGSVQSFDEQSAIGRYFQGIVSAYHAQGCRGCCYKDLEVVPLGSQSALVTVTWELFREDDSVLSSWRESYLVTRKNNDLRIVASVDHVRGSDET